MGLFFSVIVNLSGFFNGYFLKHSSEIKSQVNQRDGESDSL